MRFFFVVTFFLMTGMTFGQNRTLIDSLKKELNASTPDKQFGLLNSIGWEYRFSNPDSTIYFSQKASILVSYKSNEVSCLFF